MNTERSGHAALRRRAILLANQPTKKGKFIMLSWAITFLIIALIAAVLGFGGIAGTAAWIAQVLFVVFLILFLVSFFIGRRPPVA